MMRPRDRRLARIAAAKIAGTARPVPFVIFVRADETKAEAVAAFAEQWPNRPRDHRTLIVPAKPRTDAEREVWANSFRDRQLALVSAARRERIAIVNTDRPAAATPPKSWPSSPTIRPNGAHVTWKPQC